MERKNSALIALLCAAACALCVGEEAETVQIGVRAWSPSELAAFSTRLKNPDDAAALNAANELSARVSPAVLKLLTACYEHGGAERRLALVKILNAPFASGLLLNIALWDNSLAVRELAVRQLVSLDGPAAAFKHIAEFIQLPAPAPPLRRCRAVHSAALTGAAQAGALLRALLADPDDDVACAAAGELGGLRELDNADALLKALDSPRPVLKNAVSEALETLAGKHLGFDLNAWTRWRADMLLASSSGVLPPLDTTVYDTEKTPVDLIIAFDTTGSFLHVWGDVNRCLDAVIRELARNEPSLRVGLVRYRSVDPDATLRYTLKITPLTGALESVRRELAAVSFGGGSGALHEGLRAALYDSPWRPRARKVVVVIGDDSPSAPTENALQTALSLAHEAGVVDHIQVNTLYAKTTAGEENRQTYRQIAAAGIGRCYEYNKAEKHLVELSAPQVDVKRVELPAETARKWLDPLKK